MARFYFPRWHFPKNLGDSIISTLVPKLIAAHTKEPVEVITHPGLFELFERDPVVSKVRAPTNEEVLDDATWRHLALSGVPHPEFYCVYPEWHPQLFPFWKEQAKFFEDHRTANIITVNYLIQLGLTEYLFNNFDLTPCIYVPATLRKKDSKIRVGIVPATKLAGRPSPHPGCNGEGFRFKYESWQTFVTTLQSKSDKLEIIEISEEPRGLAQERIELKNSFIEFTEKIETLDLGVLSDGGIHHFFNALRKPIVLFTSTLINKAEFFKLGNAMYPDHLHLSCRFQCRSYFTETFGGEDLSKKCKLECENLNPVGLAEYTHQKLQELYGI